MPLLLRERLFFAWTPDRSLATNMFFQGRFRDGRHALAGTAILNSSLVLLALESRGRINIGGRINVYGPELHPLPVPDPARMDRAGLDAAGLSLRLAPLLSEALADRVAGRLGRESAGDPGSLVARGSALL